MTYLLELPTYVFIGMLATAMGLLRVLELMVRWIQQRLLAVIWRLTFYVKP